MDLLFIFDEYEEWHRSPTGALRSGEELKLRILFDRRASGSVRAIIKPDGEDEGSANIEYKMDYIGVRGLFEIFEVKTAPMESGLYWMYFWVMTCEGGFFIDGKGRAASPDYPFQITVYEPRIKEPSWFKGGILYHIFVDRFYKGKSDGYQREGAVYREDWGGQPMFRPDANGIMWNNDFFGGNLEGIIEKLPTLESLGVTCLYLSPIFEAASNHKYDTGDYMKIDPGFGDEEIFARLCREAGKLGMRVILDGVFNHVGEDSRYFNRYGRYDSIGAYQSKDSPYYSWFNFKEWNNDYDSWWGIKLLPAVNKQDWAYRRFITGKGGVLAHWMGLGASGWRLDVVDELPDDFLYPLCDAVRAEKEDALIIGEVWEDASNKISYSKRRRYLLGRQLDSVMNYPIKNAIIEFIKTGNAQQLGFAMSSLTSNYPQPALDSLMNILGTHDTIRILTMLGGDFFPEDRESMSKYRLSESQKALGVMRLKLAVVLQFTLPGVPCIYYGDEAGMEGLKDPFNRGCYPWDSQNEEILTWYRKLAQIRKSISAFAGGKYNLICARDGVFAFSRGEANNKAVIAVNTSERPARLPGAGPSYDHISREWHSDMTVDGKTAVIFTA